MEWKRGRLLGKGSYGEVFLAVPENPIHSVMAVKSAPLDKSSSLQTEHQILELFRGEPGIVQSFGTSVSHPDGRNTTTKKLNLFLEYANCGSLSNLIKGGLPEVYVKDCTRSLLQSLAVIHSKGIVHCDIKPDNILAFRDRNYPGLYRLKIADFGLAVERRMLHPRSKNYRGTLRYMPLEVVVLGIVSPAMDVWALGCTVVEMLTGEAPWSSCNDQNQVSAEIRKGKRPAIPEWISEEGKDFLQQCFFGASYERVSAEWLLLHPFVTGGGGDGLEKRRRNVLQGPPLFPHQIFEHGSAVFHQC